MRCPAACYTTQRDTISRTAKPLTRSACGRHHVPSDLVVRTSARRPSVLLKVLLNEERQEGMKTNKERSPRQKAQINQTDPIRAATDKDGLTRISRPVP